MSDRPPFRDPGGLTTSRLMPLVSRRRFSSPRWLARSGPSWKIERFRWVCRPEALAPDRASALRPPLLPSVLPASAQGFHVGRAEPLRGRRLPLLLRGFSEFSDQRPGSVFFLSSIIFPSPSTSTRPVFRWLLPRAAHVDRRDFQSDVLLWYGRDYQRTETSSPSLLEASLKVKRNNAHGWSSRSGSPQHSQQPSPRRLSLSNMYVLGFQDNPDKASE